MSKPDWLKQGEVADVQTAIQSQTIQTALERNVSDLSPQALQSFLTQAPIPRLYITAPGGQTFTDGGEAAVVFSNANIKIDSHGMFNSTVSTTNFTIPIDGFYTISFSFDMPIGNGDRLSQCYAAVKYVTTKLFTVGGYAGVTKVLVQGSGLGTVVDTAIVHSITQPWQAGDVFTCVGEQNVGGSKNFNGASVTVVWNAPFTNYQGGQN